MSHAYRTKQMEYCLHNAQEIQSDVFLFICYITCYIRPQQSHSPTRTAIGGLFLAQNQQEGGTEKNQTELPVWGTGDSLVLPSGGRVCSVAHTSKFHPRAFLLDCLIGLIRTVQVSHNFLLHFSIIGRQALLASVCLSNRLQVWKRGVEAGRYLLPMKCTQMGSFRAFPQLVYHYA